MIHSPSAAQREHPTLTQAREGWRKACKGFLTPITQGFKSSINTANPCPRSLLKTWGDGRSSISPTHAVRGASASLHLRLHLHLHLCIPVDTLQLPRSVSIPHLTSDSICLLVGIATTDQQSIIDMLRNKHHRRRPFYLRRHYCMLRQY